jgi:hypothetical protein
MLGLILCGAAVVREREHGTLEHLLVMPLTPLEIMAAKVWPNALVIVVAVLAILLGVRTSLILTSDDLNWRERQRVDAAIAILRSGGFSREVFVLAHLAHYRSSDNWWNGYVGHNQAYAATNFPFEVVTLYPWFFRVATDDTERAVILLHEAQHLLGHDEDAALDYVWTVKERVGWTQDRYGTTRVWRNTREWTQQSAPALFACGSNAACDAPSTR